MSCNTNTSIRSWSGPHDFHQLLSPLRPDLKQLIDILILFAQQDTSLKKYSYMYNWCNLVYSKIGGGCPRERRVVRPIRKKVRFRVTLSWADTQAPLYSFRYYYLGMELMGYCCANNVEQNKSVYARHQISPPRFPMLQPFHRITTLLFSFSDVGTCSPILWLRAV